MRAKHLLPEHTMLRENYIAAATVPYDGSATTCPHFAHKFCPSVKAMDRLAAAVEVPAVAADVEDVEGEEDDTRRKNANWKSYKWKTKH